MKNIKIFFLSFLVSLLFVSQSNAQWWVQGGNLLWPYGDVTVKSNLNVDGVVNADSLIVTKDLTIQNNLTLAGTINGVKEYVVIIRQSDFDPPNLSSSLTNTLGDITWSRISEGEYRGTLVAAFPNRKVFFTFNLDASVSHSSYITFSRGDDNYITVSTKTSSDIMSDGIFNGYLIIRVYP